MSKQRIFTWEDRISSMNDPEEFTSWAIETSWARFKFDNDETKKLKTIRPFFGDKVRITVEFLV